MTIPREEFNAAMGLLHKKLDSNKDHFNEKINELSKEVTELRTRFEMTPVPTIPTRPCERFQEHLDDHEAIRFVWIKSIISAVVTAVITAIGTLFLFKHGGEQ
jgi:hypothetical protein